MHDGSDEICPVSQPFDGYLERMLEEVSGTEHLDEFIDTVLQNVLEVQDDTQQYENSVLESIVPNYESYYDEQSSSVLEPVISVPEKKDCGTNTCHFLDIDIEIQNVPFTLESGSKTTVTTIDTETQASPCTKDVSSQTPKIVFGIGVMTDETQLEIPPLRLEVIKDDAKELTFYTGFASFLQLMVCYHFLGPAVTTLRYNAHSCEKEPTFKVRNRSLTPLIEFFLTLCRLRAWLHEQDLAYRFQLSQTTVLRIIVTWVNFLFCKFKKYQYGQAGSQLISTCPIVFVVSIPRPGVLLMPQRFTYKCQLI